MPRKPKKPIERLEQWEDELRRSERAIRVFKGNNAWLSNFWSADLHLGEVVYPTAEHAFQALKTDNPKQREWVRCAPTPGEAKQRGRQVTLVRGWEQVKDRVMAQVLFAKFQDPALRELLVKTHPQVLIEGNGWHDQYWGDCYCQRHLAVPGKNQLGTTLMALRDKIINWDEEDR